MVFRRYTRKDSKAVLSIQKWYRCQIHPYVPVNQLDYITLEPPQPPIFYHISPQRHVTAFDAKTLMEYLVQTGNLIHPQTRAPFNDVELRRLSRRCARLYDICPNLVAQRNELAFMRNVYIESQSLVSFMENDIGHNLDRIINICLASSTLIITGVYLEITYMQQTHFAIIDESIRLYTQQVGRLQAATFLRNMFSMACNIYERSRILSPLFFKALLLHVKSRIFQLQNGLEFEQPRIDDLPEFIYYYNQLSPNAPRTHTTALALNITTPPPPPDNTSNTPDMAMLPPPPHSIDRAPYNYNFQWLQETSIAEEEIIQEALIAEVEGSLWTPLAMDNVLQMTEFIPAQPVTPVTSLIENADGAAPDTIHISPASVQEAVRMPISIPTHAASAPIPISHSSRDNGENTLTEIEYEFPDVMRLVFS